MSKNQNKGFNTALALVALFFFLKLKKGFGTTLFGVGTQLDLTKPIEDVQAFIEASKQENERGFTGSIQPKGIYYQMNAGDQIWRAPQILKNNGCDTMTIEDAKKIELITLSTDQKIYNPTLAYLDEGGESKFLPPYVMWAGPDVMYIKPTCSIEAYDNYSTSDRADYSKFGKTA